MKHETFDSAIHVVLTSLMTLLRSYR